ncbi:MAG: adenosine kinase [Rhodobacterales bacterium]|nr:adenosine kinase [Pseudomonadota bacterium]
MKKKFQVVGIGNAMVDILSHIKEDFLTTNGVEKGIMQLIDMPRAVELYGHMGPAQEVSGGSAANTIAGIAALGGRTAYVGKVKDDQLGSIFSHDLRAQGAIYETPLAAKSETHETGRCMVLVTPDGERSLNTYLGVSEQLAPSDIDDHMMAHAEWLYLEGYRFDGPDSKAAFAKAIKACTAAGGKISLTLSDPFCVDRHRADFLEMIRDHVDLLFCNTAEMQAMYPSDSLNASMAMAAKEVSIVVCTASEKGAYVLNDGGMEHAHAVPTQIVDATGAGDLFASGFLYGLTSGFDMLTSARMGCVAAAEVISHIGARPEADLMELFQDHGLV